MINYNIDFVLNDTSIMKISSHMLIEQLSCCDDVVMILLINNKDYLLSTNTLHNNMYVLKNALKKALENQLQLHPSIMQDIGYLYNQMLQFKPTNPVLVYEPDYWVGLNNLLWNSELATWLYNDIDGNIILHITPLYPGNWTDIQFDDEANEIAYAKWIAQYKPFWTTTLSPTVAQIWLDQAHVVFNRLYDTRGYRD